MMMLDPVVVRSLLVQSTRQTWGACLGQRPGPRPTLIRQVNGYPLVSTARFTGVWTGALHVFCSPRSALGWASAMFDILPGHCADEDVVDAVAELANILAGGLLESLPFGTVLTPPTVEWDRPASCPGSQLVSAVEFDAEPTSFIVALVAEPAQLQKRNHYSNIARTSSCEL